MSNKKITIMKNKVIFFLCLQLNLFYPLPIVSQQIYQSEEEKAKSPFIQSVVRFDDSSIEMLILHPEEILADPDEFWASDSAYKLVKHWHQNISFPVPMEQWNKWMQDLKEIPVNERAKNPQLVAAKTTIRKEKEFNERAIPYLYSFLPKDCPQLTTTIYFTTAIMASGFQMGNNIVVYGAHADKDNIFIHELFHLGFDQYKQKGLCADHQDSLISKIYGDLQNEGMATYVGYKALTEFPHTRTDMLKDDYKMFENMEDIKSLLKAMNNILKKSFTLNEKELNDSLWQIGSMDRAFYVVGCFMAKTIDEKLGRDTLVETITNKPIYFVKTYNSLVDENKRIADLTIYKK